VAIAGGGVALRFQRRCTCLQALYLLGELCQAMRAGRLRQPPGFKGPQITVNRRPPFRKGCPHPGQFGLTARMLGMPGQLRAAGGLLEDRPVMQRRQDLGNDRFLQGSGGKAMLGATGGAVALSREAGVVAVDATVACAAVPTKPWPQRWQRSKPVSR
jgi:hypothetical protein